MIIIKSLDMLNIGESSCVKNIKLKNSLKNRLNDIGCVNGTEISCVFKSPSGDPTAYLVRGSIIAIRKRDSRKIEICED